MFTVIVGWRFPVTNVKYELSLWIRSSIGRAQNGFSSPKVSALPEEAGLHLPFSPDWSTLAIRPFMLWYRQFLPSALRNSSARGLG
jgi:hypothetical protein